MKIAFNPARFTQKEIRAFFRWVRSEGIFKNYSETLRYSNVTRTDIATDIIGVPSSMILVINTSSENVDFHPANTKPINKLVQTHVLGDPSANHYDVYDRNAKIFAKDSYGGILTDINNSYVNVTRIERVLRPQKNHSDISLNSLEQLPNFLKPIAIYSPKILQHINDKKQLSKIARKGFAYWMFWNQIANKQYVNQSMLDRYRTYINKGEFASMQISVLSVLKKVIIDP